VFAVRPRNARAIFTFVHFRGILLDGDLTPTSSWACLKTKDGVGEDIVHEVITPESVAADYAGVRATLVVVTKNGGDWADPGLR
jgi:hypothetical protein